MGERRPLGSGFRALELGSLVSNAGDGIRLAALPLLAASLTSSPLLISSVTAAQMLPWVTFAPVGGALVDRWDRRRAILVTQAWRGVAVGVLAALVATSMVEVWHVCVVAFLITVGEILVDPSTVALVPALVDDHDLDRANGRIASAEVATNDVAGGPFGAALFSVAPWLPFVADAATYLGSVLPFGRLPRPEPRPPDGAPPSLRTDAVDGFRWLRRHPVLWPFTRSQVLYYFGLATSLSLLVVLVTDELDASEASFGLVLAVGATGALLGTVVAGGVSARFGARAGLTGAVVLQAVTLGLTALAPSVPALAAVWFLNGVPLGVQRPIGRGLQQRLTPDHLLGRVNVTARIFTRGIIVVGALAAGGLAAGAGVRTAFIVGAAVQLAAAVAMWAALGRRSDDPGDAAAAP